MARHRDIPHDERDKVLVPVHPGSHALAAEQGKLEFSSPLMSRERFF